MAQRGRAAGERARRDRPFRRRAADVVRELLGDPGATVSPLVDGQIDGRFKVVSSAGDQVGRIEGGYTEPRFIPEGYEAPGQLPGLPNTRKGSESLKFTGPKAAQQRYKGLVEQLDELHGVPDDGFGEVTVNRDGRLGCVAGFSP